MKKVTQEKCKIDLGLMLKSLFSSYSIFNVIIDIAQDKLEIANKKLVTKRRKLCNECSCLAITNQCKRCGCFIKLKTLALKSECPLEKW